MKTQDVASELRPFWKLFEPLTRRHDASRVFDDFLSIALTQFAFPDDEQMIQLNNDARLKYTVDERHQFWLMFREMVMTVHRQIGETDAVDLMQDAPSQSKVLPWYDFFGDFYMELASRWKASAMGQFFTPAPICTMMAAITISAPDDEGKELPREFTANEPCAGSGRMVLAMNSQRRDGYYVAQDLDFMCVKMTAINMILHGVVGEVTHGNSLDPHDIRTTFRINEGLNKPWHLLYGRPHVTPVSKEQSFLKRYWDERLREIEGRQVAATEPAPSPAAAVAPPALPPAQEPESTLPAFTFFDTVVPRLPQVPAQQLTLF